MDNIDNLYKILTNGIIILAIIIPIMKIGIYILIIRAICKFLAKENAKAFDYERMAVRTAEEICKRLLLIEKQRKEKLEEEKTDSNKSISIESH